MTEEQMPLPEDTEAVHEGRHAWEKPATVIVYILAVAAFAYIGYAFFEQRNFNRLMDDLFSTDEARSAAAAEQLAATSGSYPYLCSGLKRRDLPEDRVRCATVIMRRLDAREKEAGSFESDEERKTYLRSKLDLEAVTAALGDECPEVRWKALEIIAKVGLVQNYQRTRHKDMLEFEELLTKLASNDATSRDAANQELREAGVRALPYLVGVVFVSDGKFLLKDKNVLKYSDTEFRINGLKALRTIVQDVLRGSNQRRIVTLLGRRRCRLLLAEMTKFEKEDARKVLVDILNVSGRIDNAFLEKFESEYKQAGDLTARQKLLDDSVKEIETKEKVRGTTPSEIEKARKLSGETRPGS